MTGKILFVGGSGVVGREASSLFRRRHPDIPIQIGVRDLAKGAAVASNLGITEAVSVDTARPRLGIDADATISAIVMMVPDVGLHGLRLAQEMRVPYLSIGNWLIDIGAEVAHFISRPEASPIILSSHWHAGPAVFLALATTRDLASVNSINVGAIVDENDFTGPAAIEDMQWAAKDAHGVLAFQEGKRVWLSSEAKRRQFTAVDGRWFSGKAIAPYDIVSLHAATGARNVRFDLASGVSSSRLRGGEVATELVLEVEGSHDGRHVVRRSTLEFPHGQATLTGLSAVLSLSTALGLEGRPRASPGLVFPEQLMKPEWYLDEIGRYGATVVVDRDEQKTVGHRPV